MPKSFLFTIAVAITACARISPGAPIPPGSPEFASRIWRTQDGLPENRIQALSETPDGYLWIGTPGGLVRFDGARFVVFNKANTPALVDDSVRVLYTAPDGILWAGTDGGGLLRLKDGEFQSYGPKDGLTDGFINAIHQDGHGTLWAATAHGLFSRKKEAPFRRLAEPPDLPVSAFWSLARQHGSLWSLSTAGWYRIDGDKLVGAPSRSLAAEDQPACPTPLPPGRPRYRDSSGDLWIGTTGAGLVMARGCAVTRRQSPGTLPGNTVTAIFEDRERSLWIGTEDGLLRLSRSTVTTLNSIAGFAESNIACVYRDPADTLWVTTLTGQLYRMTGGRIVPFKLPPALGDARIRTVFKDSKGTLWLGTPDRGFYSLTGKLVAHYTTKDGLRSNAINNFLEDRAGRIWIATSSGLSRWDGRALRNYYLADGLVYGNVRVLAEDASGDILAGTDGGVSRVRGDAIIADASLARLGRAKIASIHVDAAGSIWLGTRGDGLIRIAGGKIARLTTDSGLLSKSIYQIAEDDKEDNKQDGKRLWMSSPAGVFAATLKDLNAVAEGRMASVAVSAYGIADGMETTQMSGGTQPAGARMADGRLAFPSVKGLVVIDPARVRPETTSPVQIEAVLVDDTPISSRGDLSIAAGHRKLRIDFTACSLLSPERLSFRYRLRGLSDAWSVATNPRSAQFSNLPPGHYIFEVVAQNGSAPGNLSRAAIAFTWRAHFYQTWWFLMVAAAALFALFRGGFRFYLNQQDLRYALRLAERTRIARDMHDTVIQGCVGASTLLEAAAGCGGSESAPLKEFLDRARIQLRLTLDEARQALTDLRHDSFAGGLAGALEDLARGVTRESGIPVHVTVEGAPWPLPEGVNRNLLLVAREAIRNSVAHAQPFQIAVRLCFAGSRLRLEIEDDGRGFAAGPSESFATDHFGITGMRERVEQLGGSFQLRSAPGEGTGVVATLPAAANVAIAA